MASQNLFDDKRDERGVIVRRGKFAKPDWRDFLHSLISPPLIALWAIFGFTTGPQSQTLRVFIVAVVLGVLAFGSTVAVRLFRLIKKIDALTAVDAIAHQYGTDPDRIENIAIGRGIKPKMSIDGVDHYDLTEFGDMAVLLRPSSAPDNSTLLQPASPTGTEATESLLRPMHNGE